MQCFVDASYSPQYHLAVLGFGIQGEADLHLEILSIRGNAAAEKLALQRCIEYCTIQYPDQKLIIYTDHEPSLKEEVPDHVELRFTPGHLKKADMTPTQLKFSAVDKATRKKLREVIKSTN